MSDKNDKAPCGNSLRTSSIFAFSVVFSFSELLLIEESDSLLMPVSLLATLSLFGDSSTAPVSPLPPQETINRSVKSKIWENHNLPEEEITF